MTKLENELKTVNLYNLRLGEENTRLQDLSKQMSVRVGKHKKEIIGAVRRVYWLLMQNRELKAEDDKKSRYIFALERKLLQTTQVLKRHVAKVPWPGE